MDNGPRESLTDHARRYVSNVHETAPSETTKKWLDMIGEFYQIEADIRGKPPDQRRRVRQEKSSTLLACEAFGVSQTCYCYERKRNAENGQIADWLLKLTDNHRNWGFVLCFLYLRNVKGFGWNPKRIDCIYRGLELNLRIKPVRQAPESLVVPMSVNAVWPMDFMHDQLLTEPLGQAHSVL